jgi:hypothetical protein
VVYIAKQVAAGINKQHEGLDSNMKAVKAACMQLRAQQ